MDFICMKCLLIFVSNNKKNNICPNCSSIRYYNDNLIKNNLEHVIKEGLHRRKEEYDYERYIHEKKKFL